MKMLMAVMPFDEAEFVLNALIIAGFGTTFAETQGGMMRQSQHTIFTVVQDDRVDEALSIIRDNCRVDVIEKSNSRQIISDKEKSGRGNTGGAVVFCWEIERMEIF